MTVANIINKRTLAHLGKHNHNGELNPMFGKQHSEHTKSLISEANKGISKNKGASHPYLGEYNRTHIRRGVDNPNYGNHILAGIPKSEEHKQKMSKTRILRGLSKGTRNPMSREINIKKWLKSCNMEPNNAETRLYNILQGILPEQFGLNVDGRIMILGGKIPDFVNINGKKQVIELYGDYFHKGQNPENRVKLFKQYGFDCLIIWESELYDSRNKLKDKIISFVRGETYG